MNIDASEFFESNKTGAALVRESELRLVANQGPLPTDLLLVPKEQWDDCLDDQIVLPESVAKYLADREPGPILEAECHMLEDKVTELLGIEPPYYIAMHPPLTSEGRTWSYVPEAAKYSTGFILGKEGCWLGKFGKMPA